MYINKILEYIINKDYYYCYYYQSFFFFLKKNKIEKIIF